RSRADARLARWPPRGRAERRDTRSGLRPAAGCTFPSPRPAVSFAHGRTLASRAGLREGGLTADARSGLRHAWTLPRLPKHLAISKSTPLKVGKRGTRPCLS